MPYVVADRVKETTTTTGTGSLTLAGAVAGFRSFSVIGNTNTTHYVIEYGTAWEVGLGTYSTTGPTLARTTLIASSTGSFLNLAAGSKTVYCSLPATMINSPVYDNKVTIQSITVGRGGQTAVSGNVAVGASALNSASLTGANNVGVGSNAGAAITSGTGNVAIGTDALAANQTLIDNVAIGINALKLSTTNGNNVAIGANALDATVVGQNCVAIGSDALTNLVGGFSIVAIGREAARALVGTGNPGSIANTVALGRSALSGCSTGSANLAIGSDALLQCTTGSTNVGIGTACGNSLTTGSNNIYIGSSSVASAAGVSNEIVIGPSLTGKGGNTTFIGGTSGAYNGGNTTTWTTTSDRRVKKNISDADGGLDIIGRLKIRNFEYRTSDEITDLPKNLAINKVGVQLGFIAQELREVLPEMVKENAHGFLSVNTDDVLFHLVLAVQQLSKQIEELKNDKT